MINEKELEERLNLLNDVKKTNISKINVEYGQIEPQMIIFEKHLIYDII